MCLKLVWGFSGLLLSNRVDIFPSYWVFRGTFPLCATLPPPHISMETLSRQNFGRPHSSWLSQPAEVSCSCFTQKMDNGFCASVSRIASSFRWDILMALKQQKHVSVSIWKPDCCFKTLKNCEPILCLHVWKGLWWRSKLLAMLSCTEKHFLTGH